MHPLLASMLVLAATWDAWRWYAARVSATPEEVVSLALAVALLGGLGAARMSRPSAPRPLPLMPIAVLLAAYAASYGVLPPIVRAAIAIAATLFCCYLAAFRERPPIAFWGLVALALPVLPSLQFTLGYPMRVVSAALAVALLQSQGVLVARQGTFLVWRDAMVQFDAPCSGVNMLWAGLVLTLAGCVLFRLRAPSVLAAVALSVVLAIACNALRASSLFYGEVGLIPLGPAWGHDAIGIAAFMVSAGITFWFLARLRDREMVPWTS